MSHQSRINDALYKIHQDIASPLPAKQLADIACYSEQHFHRVFKQVVGQSVHQYIRQCRLEYAGNQLMFDVRCPVIEIANKSGFTSLSSFSRAFKEQYDLSPGQWRLKSSMNQDRPYLQNPEIKAAYERLKGKGLPKPRIKELPEYHVAYIRHQGYGRSISKSWRGLQSWCLKEGRSFEYQFGLHHSNPSCVPLDECRYVACVQIDKPILKRGHVNSLTIPKGLHVVFRLTGQYGELLPQLSKIYEHWLPKSGYKMMSTPSVVRYIKNQFMEDDESFVLDFCLPIGFY
ncbi:AraC family transcriptional regulator [Marinicellulosiphila megalodicopiae]|uniref:AraC family transcriptional regulator n=1 Tax=Marinicellulosiphila megalodicopiae TaxID=2724896 RepID=UPI003BAEFD2D